MVTHSSAVFAKLPTGELTIVLTLHAKNRTVIVGTRRPDTWKSAKARFKTARMFVDGLVFQCGYVQSDGSGRVDDSEPFWYDPWVCGDTWESFAKHFDILALLEDEGDIVSQVVS
jgi:hypothetical protein